MGDPDPNSNSLESAHNRTLVVVPSVCGKPLSTSWTTCTGHKLRPNPRRKGRCCSAPEPWAAEVEEEAAVAGTVEPASLRKAQSEGKFRDILHFRLQGRVRKLANLGL